MDSDRVLTRLSYGIMKLGVIVFLFPFFWQLVNGAGLDNDTGNISVRILITIFYIFVSFVVMVMSRENFNVFGFILVISASIYMFIQILFRKGLDNSLAPYFLLICISIYFMTKANRSRGR